MPEKAYVTSNNTVAISCSRCTRSKEVDVSKFKGHRDVRIKCPCGNAWQIQLEYRREYRKKTELPGSYKLPPRDRKPGDAGSMTVVDLSRTGVRLKLKDFPFALDVGDFLNIKFNLDDKNHTLVNRDVVVKNINPPYVGARFCRSADEDNIIGFYLFK